MRCTPLLPGGAHPEIAISRSSNPLLAVCVLLLVVVAGGLTGCGDSATKGIASESPKGSGDSTESKKSKPVSVEVVTLQDEPLTIEVALTGQLNAKYSVMLKSEITGVIESIEFDEGSRVEKGRVLFRLGDGEQRARLMETEAEARLAQDTFDRTQRLTNESISSIARRAEAAAALDKARAKIQLARLEVDRTYIRAPFTGVVGSLFVGPGEYLKPEITPLVEITAIDKLQLLFTLPEPSIALAQIGGIVHARVAAYPGERFRGEVFFVSPTIDPSTRRLMAKAWVPNSDHRLKPGMFANVDIIVAVRDAAILVPEAGMIYDRHGTYVWLMDENDRAKKVPVEIGYRQEGRVVITKGLQAGDRVVSSGVNKLRAGKLIDPQFIDPQFIDPSSAPELRAADRPDASVRGVGGAEG
jgi:membrane fusion protein (multidrug efflux system)